MATIQRIATDHFIARANADKPKALIVVSDMLEHGSDYSHYKGDLSFTRYKKSPAHLTFRTDLQGARVSIFYIQRKAWPASKTVEHIQFWREWIKDNKGRFEEARRLQGIG